MQTSWQDHITDVAACCSKELWYMFNTVKGETVQLQDKVLAAAKTLCSGGRSFPKRHRTLLNVVDRKAGNFWDNVLYTKKICLRQFNIPGCESVEFTYVDPIFVWAQHCSLLHRARHELQWVAKELLRPTSLERLYGAGVEYGLVFQQACRDVPAAGRVALMNLSWDGGSTGYASRSATPICMQVMNTNTSSVLGVGLIGYLPQLDVADSIKQAGGKSFKSAKHHVPQVRLRTGQIVLLVI